MSEKEAVRIVLEIAQRAVGQGMGITGYEEDALEIVQRKYGRS